GRRATGGGRAGGGRRATGDGRRATGDGRRTTKRAVWRSPSAVRRPPIAHRPSPKYSSRMPALDWNSCTRALEARDARFDGVFFVGISSTGIYCRPICPARATLRRNRRFFANAAAAERAGFRPCLRCRPELAPGLARVDAVPRLVQSAATRIAAGALNGQSV